MSLVALQPAHEDPEDSDAEVRQPQRRRVSDPEEDDFAGGEASIIQGDGNFDAMVKNMVRLALACEYSRTPIRRADITAKILGTLPSTKGASPRMPYVDTDGQLKHTNGISPICHIGNSLHQICEIATVTIRYNVNTDTIKDRGCQVTYSSDGAFSQAETYAVPPMSFWVFIATNNMSKSTLPNELNILSEKFGYVSKK
ncbi:unnamed protein product [Aureobasidium pullulans]|nr:unnamed protein product [Aureobasidium pullulans]